MIIVSQKKTGIINFKNIETLYLLRKKDKYGTKSIEINARGNYDYTLGEYATEERAKEVLQEIIDKFMEYGQIQNLAGDIKQVCEIPKKYEMPKE